jgi:CubicO group peptidase (beta-lactamase class C family)
MDLSFDCMKAIAPVYAKLGELYRLDGQLNGQQIIPPERVRTSVTPDSHRLQPGKDNPANDYELSYGYQWWIPEGDGGEFLAIGVYNQFIYINPAHGVVIVKLSANRIMVSDEESCYRKIETIEFFREIVNIIKP